MDGICWRVSLHKVFACMSDFIGPRNDVLAVVLEPVTDLVVSRFLCCYDTEWRNLETWKTRGFFGSAEILHFCNLASSDFLPRLSLQWTFVWILLQTTIGVKYYCTFEKFITPVPNIGNWQPIHRLNKLNTLYIKCDPTWPCVLHVDCFSVCTWLCIGFPNLGSLLPHHLFKVFQRLLFIDICRPGVSSARHFQAFFGYQNYKQAGIIEILHL